MKIVAFLRGINVGGHHKVPMAVLTKELTALGCRNVRTILNSGNVIFESGTKKMSELEDKMEAHLGQVCGFSIPVLLWPALAITKLVKEEPFRNIEVKKETRLYISFLKSLPRESLDLPWVSADKGFEIIQVKDRMVCSILDLSVNNTPKGMEMLEKLFGKNITTRNWNTIVKISEL